MHLLVLGRTVTRASGSDQARRRSELERLALALGAHDPERTLARGYALVENTAGDPVSSVASAREARDLRLRFRDGRVAARVGDAEEAP